MFEKFFEILLVKSRWVTILPVIFGLVGAFVLFFIASYDVIKVLKYVIEYFTLTNSSVDLHEDVVGLIIGAVDLYLMALVLF
ncbi:YqhA family protein, partial [Campylobacter volucris]